MNSLTLGLVSIDHRYFFGRVFVSVRQLYWGHQLCTHVSFEQVLNASWRDIGLRPKERGVAFLEVSHATV